MSAVRRPIPLLVSLVFMVLVAAPVCSQAPDPATETTAIEEALTRFETGDLEGTISILEPLRDRLGVMGLAMLGGVYLEMGRAEDALAVLEPLAQAPDADPAVLYNTGRALVAVGRLADAEEYLQRSLQQSPQSPAARELGLLLRAVFVVNSSPRASVNSALRE